MLSPAHLLPQRSSTAVYRKLRALTASLCVGLFVSAAEAQTSTSSAGDGALVFEAESLTRKTEGAKAKKDNDEKASGGARVTFEATGKGNWIEFTIPNVPAGTYRVEMSYRTHPTRGTLSLKMDGAPLGKSIDQYARSPSFLTATFGTIKFASAGKHTIRLTVTGQNSSSRGYTLSADSFTLVPQ